MNKKVAVTGGIGSGKSTVLSLLKESGYPVFSCDEIYREITKEASYIEEIKNRFPFAVKNGGIDRQALSKAVFNNEDMRNQLNEIAHPLIINRLFSLMEQTKSDLVFAEVPLLFECNLQDRFDATIIVLRDTSLRVNAVVERDKLSAKEVKDRINAQFDYETSSEIEKLKNTGTYFLHNDSTLFELNHSLHEILNALKNNL